MRNLLRCSLLFGPLLIRLQDVAALSTRNSSGDRLIRDGGNHRRPVTFGESLADQQQQRQQDTDEANRGRGGSLHGRRSWRYSCDLCGCGFDKLKSYEDHLDGKRHGRNIVEADEAWTAWIALGGETSPNVLYDPAATREDVIRAWSLDYFAEGLPARSRSSLRTFVSVGDDASVGVGVGGQIDPGLRVSDLSPSKKAAIWRYLRDVPGLPPGLVERMVSAVPPSYARVKEILESVETFGHVRRLVRRQRDRTGGRIFTDIYDVGCGHGLVGMLCAAAWPDVRVNALDMESRESFEAQRDAFVGAGLAKGLQSNEGERKGRILDNLSFMCGDLHDLKNHLDAEAMMVPPNGGGDSEFANTTGLRLLLCVHGCKSLTPDAIALAKQCGWAWLVLPCCLTQQEVEKEELVSAGVLGSAKLSLPDNLRFALMCGALAQEFTAEAVSHLDSRITARGIVLSSTAP